MHSSRMCTARISSRMLGEGGVSASVHALKPHQVWAWRPPPQARLLNFSIWCGPGDLEGMLGYNPIPVNRILDTRF